MSPTPNINPKSTIGDRGSTNDYWYMKRINNDGDIQVWMPERDLLLQRYKPDSGRLIVTSGSYVKSSMPRIRNYPWGKWKISMPGTYKQGWTVTLHLMDAGAWRAQPFGFWIPTKDRVEHVPNWIRSVNRHLKQLGGECLIKPRPRISHAPAPRS